MTQNSQTPLRIALRSPAIYALAALGFSAGLPLFLIFSSLSVWLKEVGISKSDITYFSWAVLAFSLKFTWAPLLDLVPIPFLNKRLGRRRSWLLAAQAGIIVSIAVIALNDPANGLLWTIIGCVMLAVFAATQDIALDAYRIEIAPDSMQGLLASSFILGYRCAMIASGAGALFLAEYYGTSMMRGALDNPDTAYVYRAWKWTYLTFIPLALIGPICTLLAKEPKAHQDASSVSTAQLTQSDYLRFFCINLFLIVVLIALSVNIINSSDSLITDHLSAMSAGLIKLSLILILFFVSITCLLKFNRSMARVGLIEDALIESAYRRPLFDFLQRHQRTAVAIIALVALYRVSDVFIGVIANLFYLDMGYSKATIASVSKVYGLVLTIVGSFTGGLLVLRIGNWPTLLAGAFLAAATNLGFIALHHAEATQLNLILLISFDNFCSGLGMTAFIAWMSSLTSRQYTAIQYALLSSLMTLLPKFFAGFSGGIVEGVGYDAFFALTIAGGLPCIGLILFLMIKDRQRRTNSSPAA